MNYLKVPDSNIKLTDGSVVMLARFPGTKWVVHYGWYDYSGRRGMGWYFSSIPAQTVIPVTSQDLQLIVLIDQGNPSGSSDLPAPTVPSEPGPAYPPYPPKPGPQPPFPPGPDSGLYPAPPDPLSPPGDPRAFFSKNDQFLLDSAFISLPSIRYRDALPTVCRIPDGKVVKINNVDGVTRYYSWNAPDQRWDEKFYENDAEKLLVNYYDKEEVDAIVAVLNNSIQGLADEDVVLNDKIDNSVADLTSSIENEASQRIQADETLTTGLNELSDRVEEYQRGLDERFDALIAADEELAGNLAALHNYVDAEFTSLKDRVAALEDAVFNIKTIVATHSNTVLVSSDGTLKDSGVSIGDGVISESSEYADAYTLATEKAVAKKVEDNVTQWSSF